MKKTIFFLVISTLLLMSCSEKKTEDANIFRMNMDEGLLTLDPAYAKDQRTMWMTAQIFEGLVDIDSNSKVIPAIAKRWEISEDGKIYTFYLRNDVFFHKHAAFGKDSTRKVLAADFVYTFTRICDKKTISTGKWIFSGHIEGLSAFNKKEVTTISGFKALNDSTLQIQLTESFPPFLGTLSMAYCYVVPKEIVNLYGEDFGKNPIGTGLFTCKKWDFNRYLLLHKNKDYYQKGLPYLSGVYVQFIASKLSAFEAFRQGKLDFINGIDNSYKDELLTKNGEIQAKYKEKYRFYFSPQSITNYVGILIDSSKYADKKHPLLDVKVRKALAYAIDRPKIAHYLLNNIAYPADGGFIPYPCYGYETKPVKGFDYQPDSAIFLLKNYAKNQLNFTLYCSPQTAYIYEFLQREWEKVGVQVKIEVAEAGSIRGDAKNSKLQLWQANWIGDYPDAETYTNFFLTKNFAPEGSNTPHFHNVLFDSIYNDAMKENLDSIRFTQYLRLDAEMLKQVPVIPLYYGRILRITQNNISGIVTTPMNNLSLKYVEKK